MSLSSTVQTPALAAPKRRRLVALTTAIAVLVAAVLAVAVSQAGRTAPTRVSASAAASMRAKPPTTGSVTGLNIAARVAGGEVRDPVTHALLAVAPPAVSTPPVHKDYGLVP